MDWSREEVEAIVADYLHMLTLELAGQSYSKTDLPPADLPIKSGSLGSRLINLFLS
jgi:hypothetical protein